MGAVFRNNHELHGKLVKLVRGGEEKSGIILAQDLRSMSGQFVFQWKDESGKACISSVTDDELENIRAGKTVEKKDEGTDGELSFV